MHGNTAGHDPDGLAWRKLRGIGVLLGCGREEANARGAQTARRLLDLDVDSIALAKELKASRSDYYMGDKDVGKIGVVWGRETVTFLIKPNLGGSEHYKNPVVKRPVLKSLKTEFRCHCR
jgi:hypothetical protein